MSVLGSFSVRSVWGAAVRLIGRARDGKLWGGQVDFWEGGERYLLVEHVFLSGSAEVFVEYLLFVGYLLSVSCLEPAPISFLLSGTLLVG